MQCDSGPYKLQVARSDIPDTECTGIQTAAKLRIPVLRDKYSGIASERYFISGMFRSQRPGGLCSLEDYLHLLKRAPVARSQGTTPLSAWLCL
jgi:hypothetical protein